MQPLTNIAKALKGSKKLPAGAVPLASVSHADMVCITPSGRWIKWWPAEALIQSMPPSTQKAVMLVLIEQLGGSTASAADKIEVSTRTVEAWRQGKSPLPISQAYHIAETLSNL